MAGNNSTATGENKKGHKVIGYGGSWQGFKTHISRYVDDKLTVVVLINQADAEPGPITDRVAEMYLAGEVK